MIPASYLFKDVYRQSWEEPEAPVVLRRQRFFDGLTTPLAGAISAILAQRPTIRAHRLGGHAYE
ncbi:hypothetical protein JI749_08680 [Devosia oryziradicis]|uniref:Uncharacterized protein n=1 Tax=Devosia oryziradicis TaxID=2801335 RepID=A0ABX7C4U6_9HYPH|nr:hypothetical protein [Devosia oryziradicis]QQR37660.1 hypothetical protein JI749_08680 [Devosia oryziradicis]